MAVNGYAAASDVAALKVSTAALAVAMGERVGVNENAVEAAVAEAAAALEAAVEAQNAADAKLTKTEDLADLNDVSAARQNLGLEIGADVQAYSPNLAEFAGVNPTAQGLALLDDADADTQRSTLGLGNMAVQAAGSVAITGGSITGITDITIADGGTGASSAADARTALGTDIAANVAHTLSAGANLQAQTLAEYIEGGPILPTMFAGTPEQKFRRGIVEASTSRDGALGHALKLKRGEFFITEPFNAEDRTSIIGTNKRGTVITADPTWNSGTYPHMVTAVNSVDAMKSMFDNALERLTINCNDIAGLSGVISDAWQEGGGARHVLVQKFAVEAIRLRHGRGGAALVHFEDIELFGSNLVKAVTGIHMEQISAIGKFLLSVANSTIAGSPRTPAEVTAGDPVNKWWLTQGIKVVNDSTTLVNVHFEHCEHGVYVDGVGHHIFIGLTGLDTVPNLVTIAPTFAGTVSMIGCQRSGSTYLLNDLRTKGLGQIQEDVDIAIATSYLPYPRKPGDIVAIGNFNGNSISLTNCEGVASIVRNSAGDYTITTTHSLPGANYKISMGSCRNSNLSVNMMNNTAAVSFLYIKSYGGTWTDDDQIHFEITRCRY